MKRGPYLSPRTAPALSEDDIVPVRELSHLGGATAAGGKTPLSVLLVIVHFSSAIFSLSARTNIFFLFKDDDDMRSSYAYSAYSCGKFQKFF
jgi:hypothetical protein